MTTVAPVMITQRAYRWITISVTFENFCEIFLRNNFLLYLSVTFNKFLILNIKRYGKKTRKKSS